MGVALDKNNLKFWIITVKILKKKFALELDLARSFQKIAAIIIFVLSVKKSITTLHALWREASLNLSFLP